MPQLSLTADLNTPVALAELIPCIPKFIELSGSSPEDSQLTSSQCCFQPEISIESLTPGSFIDLQTLTLGRYHQTKELPKTHHFHKLNCCDFVWEITRRILKLYNYNILQLHLQLHYLTLHCTTRITFTPPHCVPSYSVACRRF